MSKTPVHTDGAPASISTYSQAIATTAATGGLADCVKLNIYLTDLANFQSLNEVMSQYFESPYPARAAIQVSALPKGAAIEIDAVMALE